MGGNGMNLGISYYQGALNILKNNTGKSQFNQSLYLNFGIQIGKVSKKE